MFPFESVATATDSPRYSPGGSLRKLATGVNGISGTPVIVAFCWADAEPATSTTRAYAQTRCRFMERPFTRLTDCGTEVTEETVSHRQRYGERRSRKTEITETTVLQRRNGETE